MSPSSRSSPSHLSFVSLFSFVITHDGYTSFFSFWGDHSPSLLLVLSPHLIVVIPPLEGSPHVFPSHLIPCGEMPSIQTQLFFLGFVVLTWDLSLLRLVFLSCLFVSMVPSQKNSKGHTLLFFTPSFSMPFPPMALFRNHKRELHNWPSSLGIFRFSSS